MAWITPTEAAAAIGITPDRLRYWVRRGYLPAHRVGVRRMVVDERDVARVAASPPKAGRRWYRDLPKR